MKTVLEPEDIKTIATQVAAEVIKKIPGSERKYIRTKRIPEEYDVSKSYSEQLIRDMRESGRYEDAFIHDERILLVERVQLEQFWKERGRSK